MATEVDGSVARESGAPLSFVNPGHPCMHNAPTIKCSFCTVRKFKLFAPWVKFTDEMLGDIENPMGAFHPSLKGDHLTHELKVTWNCESLAKAVVMGLKHHPIVKDCLLEPKCGLNVLMQKVIPSRWPVKLQWDTMVCVNCLQSSYQPLGRFSGKDVCIRCLFVQVTLKVAMQSGLAAESYNLGYLRTPDDRQIAIDYVCGKVDTASFLSMFANENLESVPFKRVVKRAKTSK